MLGSAVASHAATVWDESVNGDLSGIYNAPTALTLALGSNEIFGLTGMTPEGTDRDYFSFVVPQGMTLTSLTLLDGTFVSGGVSFIGLQVGSQFTKPFDQIQATDLLGFLHYDTSMIGQNMLPSLDGAFTGLTSGVYTAWVQDTGGGSAGYAFDFYHYRHTGTAAGCRVAADEQRAGSRRFAPQASLGRLTENWNPSRERAAVGAVFVLSSSCHTISRSRKAGHPCPQSFRLRRSLPRQSRALSHPTPAWLREPLLHFIVLGALLFAVDHFIVGSKDDPNTIVMTLADDAKARELFLAQRGHDPDAKEMAALRQIWLDNEVLYREGLAMGVDKGDDAIHSSIVFKALSVVNANLKIPEVTDKQLSEWFEKNRIKYDEPMRFDLQEAALSGDRSEAAVRRFVDELNAGTPVTPRRGCACTKHVRCPRSRPPMARNLRKSSSRCRRGSGTR